MPGILYVVSTPIGNLDDMTVRAVNTLKSVALIAAEDTRRTTQLLRHFGLSTTTTSFHEHNERQKLPYLLKKLADGVDVALVSDAGTPLVSDPGQRLVARAIEEGIRVVPIPGASAVLAALAASGYPADEFVFLGFAPARSKDRKSWMRAVSQEKRTVVFFESPHRLKATLGEMRELLGKRPMSVARELTKVFETVVHTTAAEACDLPIADRGELTIVLAPLRDAGSLPQDVDDNELSSYFCLMTENGDMSRRSALAATARKFGLSTNVVYARLERLKAAGSNPAPS